MTSPTTPTIRFEETRRASVQGRTSLTSSEREFMAVCEVSNSQNAVYVSFLTFLRDGRYLDFSGNPIPEDGITIEGADELGKLWLCRVRYERPTNEDLAETARQASGIQFGAFPVGFSTTGGSARLYRSFHTTRYNVEGAAPDFGGMIGWNGEKFDGAEVVAPKLTFAIQKRSPADSVPNFAAFVAPIADLVGKTNAARFYGFSPGVCLFLGVSSGSLQRFEPNSDGEDSYLYWDVKCEFAASPDMEFQQGNATIKKPGWDAYWTLVDKSFDPTTGSIIPRVVGAYVERCYQRADFSWFAQ